MKINTNVSALSSQSYLNKNSAQIQGVMQRLSSGKRINSAADDAAGLAIATRMTSQVSGMDVAQRNAGDGKSLLQTAEGALGTVTNILQRMRDLAVQSSNGTNGTTDQASLDKEFQALSKEIDHIATKTTFNGTNLLNSSNAVTLQISNTANDTLGINLVDAQAATLMGGTVGDVTSAANAQTAIGNIDSALTKVSNARADFGAGMNRLDFTMDNLSSMSQNLAEARSRVQDADMAKESSDLAKYKILSQSSIAMLAQSNAQSQDVLSLLR